MTEKEIIRIFGKRVLFYRNMYKMTQSKLAERLDLSIKQISDVENGRSFVTADTLANLSSIFKIDVHKLFTPDEIKYDDIPEALERYSGQVKEAMENIAKDYLRKIKRTHNLPQS